MEDDSVMVVSDNLSMAPKIVVGLESGVQDLNADPNSADTRQRMKHFSVLCTVSVVGY